MFNRIGSDWSLIGPPWLIPVSLGDLAGCSVQSQVPHWVISSAALVLIGVDILMSGTGVWSALFNLTPTKPPLPCRCPLLSICPSWTVQIRGNLTLYGFVSGLTRASVSFRLISFYWGELRWIYSAFRQIIDMTVVIHHQLLASTKT